MRDQTLTMTFFILEDGFEGLSCYVASFWRSNWSLNWYNNYLTGITDQRNDQPCLCCKLHSPLTCIFYWLLSSQFLFKCCGTPTWLLSIWQSFNSTFQSSQTYTSISVLVYLDAHINLGIQLSSNLLNCPS